MSYLNHENMKHKEGDLVIGVCTKSYFDEEDLDLLEQEEIEIEDVRKFVKGQEYEVVFGLFDPNYFKLKE